MPETLAVNILKRDCRTPKRLFNSKEGATGYKCADELTRTVMCSMPSSSSRISAFSRAIPKSENIHHPVDLTNSLKISGKMSVDINNKKNNGSNYSR